ncbi:MAG: hypothetical protein OEW83_17760 [Acidimicrobiia bacterium]|nr:hypothetical protein [Acidimicrobiia bacterium]
MTRRASALRTAIRKPADPRVPTDQWYRREDPFVTAETDAAFAAFMAGDNPHLRTDEVPVVDFTSMIEKVGPDGRPVRRSSRGRSRMKLGLAALATTAILAAAVVFGFIEIPGLDGVVPESFQSSDSASTVDGSADVVGETIDAQPTQPVESPEVLSSTPDGADTGDAGEQPLSITSGD